MINNWPYSDIHELNLDWIISKVKELDTKVNDDLDNYINAYIQAHLADFTVTANYDDVNEKIIYSNGVGATTPGGDASVFAIDEVLVNVKDATARGDITTMSGDISTLQGTVTALPTTIQNILFPVGCYYTTPTNTPPTFGGSWTLVGKEFSEAHGTLVASGTEYTAGDDVTIDAVAFRRVGHTYEMRIICSAGTFSETTTNLISLNGAAPRVGFTNFPATNITTFSDTGNALLSVECTGAGTVRITDCFVIADPPVHTYTGGLSVIDITLIASNFNEMHDAACDKFIWKRAT